MKRIVSLILALALTMSVALALTSCGGSGLSGSYEGKVEAEVAGISLGSFTVTYTFSGDSVEVSSKLSTAIGDITPKTVSGTYQLADTEDGGKTITFNFGDETADGVAESGVPFAFEKGDGYIKIAGITYNKV